MQMKVETVTHTHTRIYVICNQYVSQRKQITILVFLNKKTCLSVSITEKREKSKHNIFQ